MDVVLDEVDKEVTKVKKLVKEVNEGLVLVYIHCDGRRGSHKVIGGQRKLLPGNALEGEDWAVNSR